MPVAMLLLCVALASALVATVFMLASLVKTLALKAVDMSENRQLADVVARRSPQEVPDVFQDDDDAPTHTPVPAPPRKKSPEDMWRPAKPGERIGN